MELLLGWYHGGGPMMLPLLLVAIAGFALAVERASFIGRRARVNPRPFMEHVIALARAGRFDEALASCAEHQAVLADLGLILLRSRDAGGSDLKDVADAALKTFTPTLHRRLRWLPALAIVAMLLGAAGVAGHGWQPLSVGALVAVPLVIAYALLDHEARVLTEHLEEFAVRLINAIAGRPDVRLGHRTG